MRLEYKFDSIRDRISFWWAKEHITLDYGYRRVDPVNVIWFKFWRGQVYITREIKRYEK